jgi:peptide/nickel transport system substrate-binding protein
MRADSKGNNAPRYRSAIKSVEVKDPYAFVVHCKQPSIFLLSDLGGLFFQPTGLIQPKESFERMGEDEFSKHPIGSGPYRFHSRLTGSFIKLEATDKHWRDGVPRYKYVTFRIVPEESTRIAMLKTGEADITRISREKVPELEKAGLNIIFKKSDTYVYFWCNMQWTSPLFSDIRFRKALNLAIDKESIMKHLFAGMARPVSTYAGTVISSCGGDPNLKPYPYDPVEARRLIKEAGYEGREITMVSFDRAGIPELGRVIETAGSYWEKIGLKPKIVRMDYAIFLGRWRTGKTQDMIVGIDGSENPLCADLVGRLKEKLYSKSDRTMLNDTKVDAMFDKASKSLDPAEVAKLMVDVYQYIYDQYHYIPICGLDGVLATTKRIPKWDPGDRRNERNLRDLIKER